MTKLQTLEAAKKDGLPVQVKLKNGAAFAGKVIRIREVRSNLQVTIRKDTGRATEYELFDIAGAEIVAEKKRPSLGVVTEIALACPAGEGHAEHLALNGECPMCAYHPAMGEAEAARLLEGLKK